MLDLTHRPSTLASSSACGERVRTIRSALKLAKPENSRIVAATIGGHLEVIASVTGPDSAAVEAGDAVRDASLHFLVSLVTQNEAADARNVALSTVDRLEASLAA